MGPPTLSPFYACRSRCILCELSHFHRGYVVKYKSTTKALRRTQGGLMIFLDLSKGDFYNALKAFVQCITFTPPSSGVEKRGSSIAVDSSIVQVKCVYRQYSTSNVKKCIKSFF